STAVATALSPYIGYAETAAIAKASVVTGTPIRDLVLARGLLDRKTVEKILSPEAMTEPGIVSAGDTDAASRTGGTRSGSGSGPRGRAGARRTRPPVSARRSRRS